MLTLSCGAGTVASPVPCLSGSLIPVVRVIPLIPVMPVIPLIPAIPVIPLPQLMYPGQAAW